MKRTRNSGRRASRHAASAGPLVWGITTSVSSSCTLSPAHNESTWSRSCAGLDAALTWYPPRVSKAAVTDNTSASSSTTMIVADPGGGLNGIKTYLFDCLGLLRYQLFSPQSKAGERDSRDLLARAGAAP